MFESKSYIYYVKLPFSITGSISFYKATFGNTGANYLWFLWVLFAFSATLTIFYGLFSKKLYDTDSDRTQSLISLPLFIITMLLLGSLAFIPIAHIGNSGFIMLLKPFNNTNKGGFTMNILWGGLMIFAGLFMFISASTKSNFIIYRLLVARSKVLWGDKVYLFHQISGAIIVILGMLFALGIIFKK